ncbi:MAG TPA: hypothetical protein VKU41_08855 [Polyangiaceae bacterium]|nr:hypothetical protein [Polyangiaceae bacterium]
MCSILVFGGGCHESTGPVVVSPAAEPAASVAAPPTERPSVSPPTANSPPTPKTAPTAKTPQECTACGGTWMRGPVSQVSTCNCRTHDAGKGCRDGSECEGMCVAADPPERAVIDPGPPARGFFVGHCSEFVTEFGCIRLIGRGASAAGPRLFDPPPAQVCVE